MNANKAQSERLSDREAQATQLEAEVERLRQENAVLQLRLDQSGSINAQLQQTLGQLESRDTELQQTLDRLSESDGRYCTLFELSSEGILRLGYKQPIPITLSVDEQLELYRQSVYIAEGNNAFAKMYGYEKAEDLIGLTLNDFHDLTSKVTQATIRAYIEDRHSARSIETVEFDRQGRKRYFLSSSFSTVENDCVASTWVSQVDITELREAQQALLQAEQDRVAELAKTNQALKNNLDRLATEPNLEAFLGHVLTEISQQLEIHTAWLYLYDPQTQTLQLNNWVENGTVQPTGRFSELERLAEPIAIANTPFWDRLCQTRYPFAITPDNAAEFLFSGTEDWQLQWGKRHGIQVGIHILLSVSDRPLGLLGLLSVHRSEFTSEELALVQALSQQATLAIQLTQLAAEAQQAALFEERNRLAGEIHDTLAQTFTGISIQLELVNYLIPQATTEVSTILDRISRLAQTGITEARRSVWSIYPDSEGDADLAQKLTDCLKNLTGSTDLQTQIEISGEAYPLSGFLGKNLLRIGQEAIINALKHAQAKQLSINLTYMPTQISLCIKDNGSGFDPQIQTEGFGLISISERTDRLGGQLRIMTQPGQGTEIFVQVPL
jgi:PAS domain S-box-containing protein